MSLYCRNEEEMRERIKELELEIIELKQEIKESMQRETNLGACVFTLVCALCGIVLFILAKLFIK